MSTSKLTNLFKTIENKTPMEYVRDYRLDHACKLLSFGDMPLQEIAIRLGFSHQGSFSEAFKTKYGVTPREYRKSHTVDYWPSLKTSENSEHHTRQSKTRKGGGPQIRTPFFLT